MKIAMDSAFAESWFAAKRAESDHEEQLGDALTERGFDAWEDLRCDYYDDSLELDDCRPEARLTVEHQAFLWSLGFYRCWLNHTDGMETYYYKDGNADGYRKQKC